VGNFVVFRLRVCDSLRWLVVAKRPSFCDNCDVGWRVDLLKDHFDLIEETQRLASFPGHDSLDGLAVELNVQTPECGLKLFEVHDEVGGGVPLWR